MELLFTTRALGLDNNRLVSSIVHRVSFTVSASATIRHKGLHHRGMKPKPINYTGRSAVTNANQTIKIINRPVCTLHIAEEQIPSEG